MSNSTNYPWYNETDIPERNEIAKQAYTALLTVTVKQPNITEYSVYSDRVKEIAKEHYHYEFEANEPVSTFVTAFYDSILLYSHALNSTLTKNKNALHGVIKGSDIVKEMWNRTFNGITGTVTIDSNGDRLSDYSLLDMNPDTFEFEVVANYYHDKKLQYVNGKKIHWAGGRETAPPDKPICGFDNSLCPDTCKLTF